jgi:hypothetical protein
MVLIIAPDPEGGNRDGIYGSIIWAKLASANSVAISVFPDFPVPTSSEPE